MTSLSLTAHVNQPISLAVTDLCDALWVVDIHSVIVHQLHRLTVLLYQSWTIATAFTHWLQQAPRWQTSMCTERCGSYDLRWWPSTALLCDRLHWLQAGKSVDCIQTMLISLQGTQWHGTKLHIGFMWTGLICFYSCRSPICGLWRPSHPSY